MSTLKSFNLFNRRKIRYIQEFREEVNGRYIEKIPTVKNPCKLFTLAYCVLINDDLKKTLWELPNHMQNNFRLKAEQELNENFVVVDQGRKPVHIKHLYCSKRKKFINYQYVHSEDNGPDRYLKVRRRLFD